jgi:uncharacterized membrane protein
VAPVLPANAVTFLKIVALTGAILLFFRTRAGDAISKFFPTPFWIYFLSIVAGTVGFLPSDSPVYGFISLYVLTAALFLMLIGTPVTHLVRMGPTALLAISLAVVTMVVSALISYALFASHLPEDAWKAVGALLGTWVGGSANMLAVKEILAMPDAAYTPLIIVDTVLSYAWMALLVAAAAYQEKINRLLGAAENDAAIDSDTRSASTSARNNGMMIAAILTAGAFAAVMGALAKKISPHLSLLSTTAWALLLTSTLAIFLALTPLRRLEEGKASAIGQFFLCIVLVSIGAKTTLGAAMQAPVYVAFGAVMLILHGVLMLVGAKLFRTPLFFLSTASQAAVGGPVSAPIVAGVYRPNQAHIGVLMAIFGALLGTYVGVAGGFMCKWLGALIR